MSFIHVITNLNESLLFLLISLSEGIVYRVMEYLEAKDDNIKNHKNLSTTNLNLLKIIDFGN